MAHETLLFDGVIIAPGVADTIVALAAEHVEGVVGVTQRPALRKRASAPNVELAFDGENLEVAVAIVAHFGYPLGELGQAVQAAVSDALETQLGTRPSSVDVYIDAIAFED